MEPPLMYPRRQLVSTFLEITVDQTVQSAFRFLRASNWNLEDAVNLFLQSRRNPNQPQVLPLPSVYPHHPLPGLFFNGSFEEAKTTSSREDLWLLVNLQSKTKFVRDLWSNDIVSEAIWSNFILLQVYDDTEEGQKLSYFYKIDSNNLPIVLLINPITGQKLFTWKGKIEAQSFVDDLLEYMGAGPHDHEHVASLTSNKRIRTEKTSFLSNKRNKTEETCSLSNHTDDQNMLRNKFEYPLLTEPNGDCDRSLICSVCVRFPDGRRKQRKFLKNETIQVLWSFCYSLMEESEKKKMFKLVLAIPGEIKTLEYGVIVTFDQSGIDNSLISVTWD